MFRLTTVAILILCAFPVATAGAEKFVGDVKSLAGDWRSAGLRSPALIHINEDGTYTGTAATGVRTTGKIAVTGDQMSYQSSTSTGTVTFSQEDGRDVLTFFPRTGQNAQRLERVK